MLLISLLKPLGELVSFINYKVDRLRLAKLIARGLKVGRNVYIMEDVEFDRGYPYLIEIGDNCRIGKGVRILSHDATTFRDVGVTRLAPVRILEGSFIGERSIILPGVTIGPRALIAAGSVVNRDIGEDRTAAGNPARPYGSFSELLSKYREQAISGIIFRKDHLEKGTITPADISGIMAKHDIAFIAGVPQEDPYYVNTDINEIRLTARRAYDELIQLSSKQPSAEKSSTSDCNESSSF